jgi:hypothetical protein
MKTYNARQVSITLGNLLAYEKLVTELGGTGRT